MKKIGSKKASKSSLKKLKEEINSYIENQDYSKSKEESLKFIQMNPNNSFGYISYIKSSTNNYNKYLDNEALKEVKRIYNDALEVLSKNEKASLKKDFDDYLYDIKETENLNKIKKEIITNEFLKIVNNEYLTFINQNLNTAKTYAKDGKRIKNIYDFIRGVFLFACLVYNLIYRNYMLVFTIPFGIFGFINIYSFFEMNFFNKGKYKEDKRIYKNMQKNANLKIGEIKEEINKIDSDLSFLKEQKLSSISKIPELFTENIKEILIDDEKVIAEKISTSLASNDVVKFTLELEENTNLKAEDIINKFSSETKKEDDEVLNYINSKMLEKKDNQTNILVMKKIKLFNIFVLALTLFISIGSIIIIANNFYELNLYAFILALIVGAISILTYNIDTGKHSSLSDTYYDNLINTVFNATLTYDLIYAKITNGLSFTYGFLQIPITLLLIFIGFVKLISILKYYNLYKKLSK